MFVTMHLQKEPKGGSDILRFSKEVGLIHIHYWKSVHIRASRSKLEKFHHRSILLSIKYNCAVLFLRKYIEYY